MKDSESDAPPPVLTRDRAQALRVAETDAEHRLWARLRNRQVKSAKFRRQHPIGPYTADFFCLHARLVIELDGGQHDEQMRREADERRTQYLQSRGYTVLRFWNNEVVKNTDGVLQAIAEHLPDGRT